MSHEEQERYIASLESLLVMAMSKLGNDLVMTDEEIKSIEQDMVLDVVNTDTGIHIRMVKDVQGR